MATSWLPRQLHQQLLIVNENGCTSFNGLLQRFIGYQVNTATQSIVELERQLRVDEERLDSLELAKKVRLRVMLRLYTGNNGESCCWQAKKPTLAAVDKYLEMWSVRVL